MIRSGFECNVDSTDELWMFYPIHPNELLAIPPLKLDINYTAKVIFQALIKFL